MDQRSRGRAIELSIAGMTCGGCANTVQRVLSRVAGVTGATVELASGSAVVTGTAGPEELVAALETAGYHAEPTAGEAIG